MGGLEGKRIVVTGSSHGIGRAVAVALAAQGARVVVNGSGEGAGGREAAEADLGNVVAEIESAGGEGLACIGSVVDPKKAGEIVETAVDGFGGLDGLINCAGIAGRPENSILEIDLDDWRRVVSVHLDGTFFCCRAALPHLLRAGGGSILNTSSHGAFGAFGGTAYPAAKGAINSLTLALANDLRSEGIRVNAVCPGARTRLSSGPDYAQVIARLEARGMLNPEAVAASLDPPPPEQCAPIYAYLQSDFARGVTGRVFSASGAYVGVFDVGEERMVGVSESPGSVWTIDELARRVPASLGAES